MSNPERLTFKRPEMFKEELVTTVFDENMDRMRDCAVPREEDLARALSAVSDEWFDRFMGELQKLSPQRALVVSRATERIKIAPTADALADVAGGDFDPGFGSDPEDSARLLEIYQAIDAIGWNTPVDEERGDYLGRLREIREELSTEVEANNQHFARADKWEKKARLQRVELRRFNREARARKEGAREIAPSTDRWRIMLSELEQKQRDGKANVIDLLTAQRLREWLGK